MCCLSSTSSCVQCGKDWPWDLAACYIATDILMMAGYCVLGYLFLTYLRPRHVTVLRRIFLSLSIMAILCGLTHGVRVMGFFFGVSWFTVGTNLVSSVSIWILLMMLIPMLPAIMKFPSASKMSKANNELREEVSHLLETNAKLATVDNLKAVENISCAIRAIRGLSQKEYKA